MLYEVDNFLRNTIYSYFEDDEKISQLTIKISIEKSEGNRIMVSIEDSELIDYDLFGEEYLPLEEAKEEAYKIFCYIINTYKCKVIFNS